MLDEFCCLKVLGNLRQGDCSTSETLPTDTLDFEFMDSAVYFEDPEEVSLFYYLVVASSGGSCISLPSS